MPADGGEGAFEAVGSRSGARPSSAPKPQACSWPRQLAVHQGLQDAYEAAGLDIGGIWLERSVSRSLTKH
jgi:hypothetical protein